MLHTAQKKKFSITDFFQYMCPNPQETADLVTFTEEIRNGTSSFFIPHAQLINTCTTQTDLCESLSDSC